MKNNSGSDINPGYAVTVDGSNLLGGTNSSVGCKLPPTSGSEVTIGITMETIKAGAIGRVRVAGLAVAKASGSVTAGTYLQAQVTSGNEGKLSTCGSGKAQIAFALEGASDGEDVLVTLAPARNA